MKNNQEATHNHKRMGSVVLLETTLELAKVLIPASDDEFWVMLTDLTMLVGGAIEKSELGKKQPGKSRPNASPNNKYHVVRVA
jgi:hypothetical protein